MKNEIRELSHSKCGCPQGHVGSNPTFSANKACNCNGYRLLNFLEIAVTEPFLYLLHLNSVCKKETCRAMAKIMERHMFETMFL